MNIDCLEEKVIYGKLTGGIPIFSNLSSPVQTSQADTSNSANVGDKTSIYAAEMLQHITAMDALRENLAFRQLYSCRKYIGKFIVFFKRVVRKCLKWYIEPICFQQTEFNNAAFSAFICLTELQKAQMDRIETLENMVRVQAEQSEHLDREIREYHARLNLLEKQLHDRNEQIDWQQQQIAYLKTEHTKRLDELEENYTTLENSFSLRLNEAEQLLHELEDEGAFLQLRPNADLYRRSSAQSGEDAILAYICMVLGIEDSKCSYLDLGANHAIKYSNTYYFYQRGARGVLVEANPELIPELKLYRSGDVILNRCIAEKSDQSIDFYIISGDGLSTTDKNQAEAIVSYNPALYIEQVVRIQTISINEILDRYFDGAPVILNIDIEGGEMDILTSIDFKLYRPLAILIEMIPYRSHLVIEEKNQAIVQFMNSKNYTEYAFTGINSIFLDKDKIKSRLTE